MNNKFLQIYIIFIFISMSFSITGKAYAGTIIKSPAYLGLNRGLVGCWSFDGSYTKVPDCSGNNNTGTITGATKTAGKIGQALKFDGVNDYLDAGDPTSGILDFGTGPMTVIFWTKAPYKAASFISKKSSIWTTNPGWALSYPSSPQTLYTIFDDGTTHKEYNTGITTINNWKQIGLSRDNDGKIYFLNDGKRINTGGTVTGSVDNTTSLQITKNYGYLNGLIDDVRVYNRALSANEIQRLYRIGLGSVINRTPKQNSLDKGLVGHWTFDGPDISGTRAKDRSGNNNHGTLTNGPVPAIGKIGQALKFDGVNDYVDAGDNLDMIPGSGLTLSAWVNITTHKNYNFVIDKLVTGGNYRLYVSDNKKIYFGIRNSADTYEEAGSNQTLNTGQWYHILATFDDNTTSRIYINGSLDNTKTNFTITRGNTTAPLRFGYSSNNGVYYNGLIDDVRVYNRALSVGEIKRLYDSTQSKYNSSQTGNSLDKGLVGHWTFDGPDISGTRAKDRSGNNNHGTLTNGPVPATGKIGQALKFDGANDYVDVGDNDIFTPSSSGFTASAWAKFNGFEYNATANQQRTIIVGKFPASGAEGSQWEWGLQPYTSGNSNPYPTCDTTTLGGFNISLAQDTSQRLSTGMWYHFVCTITSDGAAHLYLNGINVANGATGALPSNGTTSLKIGRSFGSGNQWDLNGLIDNVRVYNRALSAGEIQKLYNMGR